MQSKKKNEGSVPKDQFPLLLKKLMEMLNRNKTLLVGFASGIVFLGKTNVLNRLPRDPPQDSKANSSVSEVFTKHLRQLRGENQTDPVRKMHRKKADVVPSRSIGTIIEKSDQEAGPSTSATSVPVQKNPGNKEPQEAEFISDKSSTSESKEEENQSPEDKENQRPTKNLSQTKQAPTGTDKHA